MNPEIIPVFPTPIYRTKLNKKLDKKELLFIEKTKTDCHANEGNLTSNNSYILNNKTFKNLKKEINLIIKDYVNKIILPQENLIFEITQSWLNYTETNQYHHKHQHPNSLISGVLYINCNEKFDKITFFKSEYNTIRVTPKSWNWFNSSSWWVSVKTGDIILFPSSLTHMVETKEGDNTRISLAFNVFVKGRIGDKKQLTELYL